MAAAGMIGAMSLGSVFTSYAADGWSKSNDSWTYIYNGQTHTGWLQTSEGWYYMDLSTGHMSTGFKQIDGKWYYFNTASDKGTLGAMLANTTTPDGYQVDANGAWIR